MAQSKGDVARAAKEAIWRASDEWHMSVRQEVWLPKDRRTVLEVQDQLDKLFTVVRDLSDLDQQARDRMDACLREVQELPTAPRLPDEDRL